MKAISINSQEQTKKWIIEATRRMGFSTNPFSLIVPDSVFDLLQHRVSAASAVSPSSSDDDAKSGTAIDDVGCSASLSTQLVAVFSLLTIKPFSKLEAEDFAGDTPPWTTCFLGDSDSYSFPSSSHQAGNRVHENVKRFARNYATLFTVFLTCALYEMPLALLGVVTNLAFWELFKFCSDRWENNHHPMIRQIVVCIAQCATVSLLTYLNVQMAIFYALVTTYTVVILHGGFRNLNLSEKPSEGIYIEPSLDLKD
ncbi:unnamed protein product [Thlaspi arvense]|uniref:PRA1 family protein n=1 Tax=Thlaspi arvense TaxID=13288 RepID=A0AAU9SRZ9_THLAR|nr:unnamed protein product [Thlaspi arvense]